VIGQVNGERVGEVREILDALASDRSKVTVEVQRGNGRHTATISAER